MNTNLAKVTSYQLSSRAIFPGVVTLDWNESPYQPIPVIEFFEKNRFTEYNSYPDSTNLELRKAISNYTNVDLNFIEVFNGSDSALDYLFRILLNSGDMVLIPSPNYTQINQTILSLGGNIITCSINDLQESIKLQRPKLVYLSNPNNPLGYCIDVLPMIRENSDVFFIVDEAYHEFSPTFSVYEYASSLDNLMVTRTFSKALSLASLRLGYITSNAQILQKVRSIKNFKEVNSLAEVAGVVTLQNIEWYLNKVSELNKTRDRFVKSLKNVEYYESEANFVLIQSDKSDDILTELSKNNILVRDRSSHLSNSIRISIGTPDDMNLVSNVINKLTV
jgi:histidinol-phosphate aminotransferase